MAFNSDLSSAFCSNQLGRQYGEGGVSKLLATCFVFLGCLVDVLVPVCPETGASSSLTAGCQCYHSADPIAVVSL